MGKGGPRVRTMGNQVPIRGAKGRAPTGATQATFSLLTMFSGVLVVTHYIMGRCQRSQWCSALLPNFDNKLRKMIDIAPALAVCNHKLIVALV